MNTNGLVKMYDRLTPRERLPLIVAASARADAAERARLVGSASNITFGVPDHYGLAHALNEAANFHLLTLLDIAANFWHWWGMWGWQGQRRQARGGRKRGQGKGKTKATDPKEIRRYFMVRYYAFLLLVHVDGWKQFGSELSVDPEVLLDFMPGWDMIVRTETEARRHAFTSEDAAMFLLGEALDTRKEVTEELELPNVVTAECLAREWHAIVDRRTE